jgi:hypothetical protein
MAAISAQFGKTGSPLRPAKGVDAGDPRFQAAQLQHLVANIVREELLAQNLTLQRFLLVSPKSAAMSYDRLVRIQRGETMMQLADLYNWANIFPAVRRFLAEQQFDPVPEMQW